MNKLRVAMVSAFVIADVYLFYIGNIPALVVFLPMTVVGYVFSSKAYTEKFNEDNEPISDQAYAGLSYAGSELGFTDSELTDVLTKHAAYYTALSLPDQHKFLQRLKEFMNDKTFDIHDDSGFKEMPILISAAAIQLTFGLDSYMLPFFKTINVFPETFVRETDSGTDILEGNVSGSDINISWAYFLEGFDDPTDGKNVGLHEMSHALYYQTMVADKGLDTGFSANYKTFDSYGGKIFNDEKDADGVLFNDYAFKNIQEFWAQSVELFFERGTEMKQNYPELYRALTNVLKQDPANNIVSIRNA